MRAIVHAMKFPRGPLTFGPFAGEDDMAMESASPKNPDGAISLPEAVARTIRHEVGDLLQTVYATAAILQERLPPEADLERRVVADMRTRAILCKNLLDTVHDLVCPIVLNPEPVDLADMARTLTMTIATRHADREVEAVASPTPTILGDVRRLAQVGNLLLAHACASARREVQFRTGPGPEAGQAEWSMTHDGPGVPAEQIEHLFVPFQMSRHIPTALGLALVRKLVLLHGGQVAGENLPEGGFRVRVMLPPEPPTGSQ
jgi:signal transduction histidine kinase